jgi:ABC-type uncharacterized transport system involved in gliding motility auxiliary subunit
MQVTEKETHGQDTDEGREIEMMPSDPRLVAAETAAVSPLILAGKIAGWVGLAALIVGLFWTGITKTMGTGPKVLLILGIVGLACWLATNVTAVVAQVRARGVQAVLNSVLFTAFVIGIIVMANYIAGRHHIFRADWSEAKLHSLSQGTLDIVRNLDKDVTITAFLSPDYPGSDQTRTMLGEYEIHGKRISLKVYDPALAITKVEEFKPTSKGSIFVECGERKEEIQVATEEKISSAILAVTTGEKIKAYFLTGHGEQSLDAYGEQGLKWLKTYLENEQYAVESLSLMTQEEPTVPGDCAVLAIIGAKQELLEKEKAALRQYVEQAGNLFIALASPPAPDFADLLEPYGVRPLTGLVMDPASGLWGNPQVPMVTPDAYAHEIVKRLNGVALPTTIAFEVETPEPPMPGPGAPPPPPSVATGILESSGYAWLETSTSGAVTKDADEKTGPLTMAVAIDLSLADQQPPAYPGAPPMPEDTSVRKGRLVVIGDYDFIRDDLYDRGLQENMFLATASFGWLARNDKLVTIPPHEPLDRTMILNTTQKNLAVIISAVLIPLMVLTAGIVMWWRRR